MALPPCITNRFTQRDPPLSRSELFVHYHEGITGPNKCLTCGYVPHRDTPISVTVTTVTRHIIWHIAFRVRSVAPRLAPADWQYPSARSASPIRRAPGKLPSTESQSSDWERVLTRTLCRR